MSSRHLEYCEQEHEFFMARLVKIKQHIQILKQNGVYDGWIEDLKDIEKAIDKFGSEFPGDYNDRL